MNNLQRATIARLRNEKDSMKKERGALEKRTEELEKAAQECRKLPFIRRYRGQATTWQL